MSGEFMEQSFLGETFHDTVYITSNPFAIRLPKDTFFETLYLIDEWNADIGTIYPEDVIAAAEDIHEEHPDKRLILHFMQPHCPYLGPKATELRERVDLVGYRNEGDGLPIWGAVKEGKVTVDEVRTAYSESLDIVLNGVEKFLVQFDGKTVITADHGEMLGESIITITSRVWGHSEGFSTSTLRVVPWLVVDADERREICSSEPVEFDECLDTDEIAEQLEALGYAD